jgi:predicted GIY-YIG superfamily endonuclease
LYYKGVTLDIERRLAENNNESPYTRKRGPWELIAAFEKPDRSSAMILEIK